MHKLGVVSALSMRSTSWCVFSYGLHWALRKRSKQFFSCINCNLLATTTNNNWHSLPVHYSPWKSSTCQLHTTERLRVLLLLEMVVDDFFGVIASLSFDCFSPLQLVDPLVVVVDSSANYARRNCFLGDHRHEKLLVLLDLRLFSRILSSLSAQPICARFLFLFTDIDEFALNRNIIDERSQSQRVSTERLTDKTGESLYTVLLRLDNLDTSVLLSWRLNEVIATSWLTPQLVTYPMKWILHQSLHPGLKKMVTTPNTLHVQSKQQQFLSLQLQGAISAWLIPNEELIFSSHCRAVA